MEPIRLQRFLSQAGVASRRHAEEMILAGQVTINGKTITELGTKVNPKRDEVAVSGKVIKAEKKMYLLLNKPKGYVSTAVDPQGRPTVFDMLKDGYIPETTEHEKSKETSKLTFAQQKKRLPPKKTPPKKPFTESELVRLFSVGRLDYNTEGALLLTNDGELAHRLMHPRYGVEKLYHAKFKGHLSKEQLQTLRQGVVLPQNRSESTVKAKIHRKQSPPLEKSAPASVIVLAKTEQHTWLEIIIHEGKNRQIHRMAEAIGSSLLKLARLEYASLSAAEMQLGTYRPLTNHEIEILYRLVGLDPSQRK